MLVLDESDSLLSPPVNNALDALDPAAGLPLPLNLFSKELLITQSIFFLVLGQFEQPLLRRLDSSCHWSLPLRKLPLRLMECITIFRQILLRGICFLLRILLHFLELSFSLLELFLVIRGLKCTSLCLCRFFRQLLLKLLLEGR